MTVHIGTSGWHYQHWKGTFYPGALSEKMFLHYYTNHFHTVEINNSFYHLPSQKAIELWKDTVPDNFIFSVKASRFITHMKKLKDPQKSLKLFFERIELLHEKLGPILFQLPPNWNFNYERLITFLKALPKGYRYTIEFRDPRWFTPLTYEALEEYGIAFCIYDLNGRLSPKQVTADFVYLRLHGPDAPYQGQYSTEVLTEWSGDFALWAGEGREIFCYFDNDQFGYAAQDALKLQQIVGGNLYGYP